MIDIKKIHADLGISTTYRAEIDKFNNRILKSLEAIDDTFSHLDDMFGEINYDRTVLKSVEFYLGKESTTSKIKDLYVPSQDVHQIAKNFAFINILFQVLEDFAAKETLQLALMSVKRSFDLSLMDLGYQFKGKKIVLSDAKELDEVLITENLDWLRKYPDSREKYSRALSYKAQKNYTDAITNAYSALEGMVMVFLNSKGRLDKPETRIALLKRANLDGDWATILKNYSEIANTFSSRHGKKSQEVQESKNLPELTEFYIYITGAFLRLISQF